MAVSVVCTSGVQGVQFLDGNNGGVVLLELYKRREMEHFHVSRNGEESRRYHKIARKFAQRLVHEVEFEGEFLELFNRTNEDGASAGVKVQFLEVGVAPLGTCVVYVVGNERAFLVNLSTANCYDFGHLKWKYRVNDEIHILTIIGGQFVFDKGRFLVVGSALLEMFVKYGCGNGLWEVKAVLIRFTKEGFVGSRLVNKKRITYVSTRWNQRSHGGQADHLAFDVSHHLSISAKVSTMSAGQHVKTKGSEGYKKLKMLFAGFIMRFTAHAMKNSDHYNYPIGKKGMQLVGINIVGIDKPQEEFRNIDGKGNDTGEIFATKELEPLSAITFGMHWLNTQ